jgi:hypothetical protein
VGQGKHLFVFALDGEQAFVIHFEQKFDSVGVRVGTDARGDVRMAAIAYPHPSQRPVGPRHLMLVPPHRRRRRSAIYWRRRVVVLVGLVLFVLAARAALGVLGGGPLAAPGAPAGRSAAAAYVVQSGDTWWSIARHIQPSGDLRALVDHLAAGHRGAALQPGERLILR